MSTPELTHQWQVQMQFTIPEGVTIDGNGVDQIMLAVLRSFQGASLTRRNGRLDLTVIADAADAGTAHDQTARRCRTLLEAILQIPLQQPRGCATRCDMLEHFDDDCFGED